MFQCQWEFRSDPSSPPLWNVKYDNILQQNYYATVKIVDFADDLATVIVGRHSKELQVSITNINDTVEC